MNPKSGAEVFIINNKLIKFCGSDNWKGTSHSCNKRVQYLMKKFLLPRDDIILNLLKLSECVCDDGVARSIMNSHALVPPNEMVDTHSVMRFAIIQLWLSLLIVSILMWPFDLVHLRLPVSSESLWTDQEGQTRK